ncbi:MAG: hypothetical protein KAT14_04685, partial [Candidatus Marinimicrobia bacterium]|nr:hypothetical protein [Candidatus Neomarinimicrobiota bacterium]
IECLVNDFLGNHLKKEIKNMGLQIEMINHAVSEITESGKLFKDYEFSVEVKNKNETALSWSYQQ